MPVLDSLEVTELDRVGDSVEESDGVIDNVPVPVLVPVLLAVSVFVIVGVPLALQLTQNETNEGYSVERHGYQDNSHYGKHETRTFW